jgi:hypothetical protein
VSLGGLSHGLDLVGRLDLLKGLGLYLAYALAADVETRADFSKRTRMLALETETEFDHLALALVHCLEHPVETLLGDDA